MFTKSLQILLFFFIITFTMLYLLFFLAHACVTFVSFTEGREGTLKSSRSRLGGQQMDLIMFADVDKEPNAVCNDGTRGGYYFSSAVDPSQADVFVIYLPGGGQCWDEASCASRGGTYISSKTFPLSRTVYGVLDADPAHTPLWGANKAYLGYCSSDGYMGDVGASEETWGWEFRGQALVRAMVRALTETHGLQSARKIYVIGSSAGGRGVMVHLDALVASPSSSSSSAQELEQELEQRGEEEEEEEEGKPLLPAGAEVIGFLDSPYYLDISPYSADFQGFAYQEQQKFLLFNTTGIIDADCAAVYPTEQWKCQFGQYRMPFVETPYFMISSLYDSYQLGNNIQAEPVMYDEDMMAYATAFGALDRDDLNALTVTIESKPSTEEYSYGYGIFAWACYNHAVAVTSLFYEATTSEGVSQKEAFEEYLSRNPASPTVTSRYTSHASANAAANASSRPRARERERKIGEYGLGNGPFVLTWMDSCEEFACDQNC